jgi:hypothetical protein
VRSGAMIVLSGAVLGIAVGLLWAVISPREIATAVAGVGVVVANVESPASFEADLILTALVLVVGCALLAVVLRRHGLRAPLAVILALPLATILCGFVAAGVGSTVGRSAFHQALAHPTVGASYRMPVSFGARSGLLADGFIVLAIFVAAYAIAGPEDTEDDSSPADEAARPLPGVRTFD